MNHVLEKQLVKAVIELAKAFDCADESDPVKNGTRIHKGLYRVIRLGRKLIAETPVKEDQSKNGVKVIVNRFPDGSTTVETDCSCFGGRRAHSNPNCPNLSRKAGPERAAARE